MRIVCLVDVDDVLNFCGSARERKRRWKRGFTAHASPSCSSLPSGASSACGEGRDDDREGVLFDTRNSDPRCGIGLWKAMR